MELKDLVAQMNEAAAQVNELKGKHEAELKTHGDALTETKTALQAAEAKNAELQGLFEKLDAKFADVEAATKRMHGGRDTEVKSFGEAVIGSAEFKELGGNGKSLYVEMSKKNISGLANSAGALTRPDRDPEVYRNPNRSVRIRDLIPTLPCDSNAVEFMRQNVFTNNAGPQGTTAGVAGGEFAAKAQSNITWELVTKSVPTIAHWVPASRQILSDAPQLAGLINQDLSYGLDLESDNQLLLGDGTGQNMTGLLVDAGVSDIGQIASGTTSAQLPAAMIDHIRKAVTRCQTFEYYNIGGVVLNPLDFEKLETAKATDGHYILMPFAATNSQPSTVWRVPVIITNAMPEGQFLLGDWTMGAKIRDRESVSVRVAEQHADLFVKNGVVVLAEERYVLTIPRPKAFCKGSFTVAA